jgi:hypothetical protein
VDRIEPDDRHPACFLVSILTLDGPRTARYVPRPGGEMRASIVMMLCTGCGIFGGGKSLEGRWEGSCNTEDDNGNDYDYDVTLDLRDIDGGDAEGDGEFSSTVVITYVTTPFYENYYFEEVPLDGDGEVTAERDGDEWTIEGNDWDLNLDGEGLDDLDTANWELVGTVDGEELTGEIELDLADVITVRGDCDFELSQ